MSSVIYDARNQQYYEEKPYENIDVVDRIGSGDAYVGGVLYGLLSEGGGCRRALEYGNAAGAFKNTVPGDLPSCTRRELDQIIRNHQASGEVLEMNR